MIPKDLSKDLLVYDQYHEKFIIFCFCFVCSIWGATTHTQPFPWHDLERPADVMKQIVKQFAVKYTCANQALSTLSDWLYFLILDVYL